MKENKAPEKYQTCHWLWNYGSIGLTKEHIKRLNNAINILESLNEHTDVKYLKEIKDKLLEDTQEPKIVKINTDAFIKKACDFFEENIEEEDCKIGSSEWTELRAEYKSLDSFIRAFVKYMKGE